MISISNADAIIPHPKGTDARVLLSSVFGPYAQDDEFGSRAINPMELYHNQVTREQGSFSLRMFHRSWGLMMIQQNISAPSTLLDFPTLDRFERELRATEYDIVGISGIIPNFGKVREMCRMRAQAVAEVDHHRRRARCGDSRPRQADRCRLHRARRRHRAGCAAISAKTRPRRSRIPKFFPASACACWACACLTTRATLRRPSFPSVGCPMGCNFCTTSAFFGGKGKSIHFYKTGDELFDVMEHMERSMSICVVLHDGRKFPAESPARNAVAGAHESRRARAGRCMSSPR